MRGEPFLVCRPRTWQSRPSKQRREQLRQRKGVFFCRYRRVSQAASPRRKPALPDTSFPTRLPLKRGPFLPFRVCHAGSKRQQSSTFRHENPTRVAWDLDVDFKAASRFACATRDRRGSGAPHFGTKTRHVLPETFALIGFEGSRVRFACATRGRRGSRAPCFGTKTRHALHETLTWIVF